MKPLQLVAVLATLLLCLAGVAWISKLMSSPQASPQAVSELDSSDTEADAEDDSTSPSEDDPDHDHYDTNPFTPARTGDQPRAELVEATFQFGRMGLGQVGEHEFTIRNTGKVPLKIAKGPTQCKCTVSGVKDQEVPPGGEAMVHLAWEPKSIGPFAQTATIWTNDPEHLEMKIGVEGEMFREIDVQPAGGWKLGNLTTSNPTPFTGLIQSPVIKEFGITKVETSSDRVKVESVPLSKEELEASGEFLSGYLLKGELAGISEPGKVEETITVYTDLKDYPKFELPLTASRIGAITIIGPHWIAGGPLLNLGKVSAKTGKEFKLTVMVPPGKEEFKFLSVDANPGFVQVRLRPEKLGQELARERYSMIVTVPPESPKGVWGLGRSGKLVVKTNHPQVPELDIELYVDVE